jgi:Subtilase family
MVDFTDLDNQGVRDSQPPTDPHGHGTAMAQIIHCVNNNAAITPVRVLDAANQGESYEILAGLQYALYSNEFDCVTACLSTAAIETCASSFGRTMEWMIGYTQKQPQAHVPVVIAAAGNDGPANSEYLAQMAGVVVAVALDDQGNDASYNSIPPNNADTKRAYGGTEQQPVGTIGTNPLFGTSIAAAAITGAYLP